MQNDSKMLKAERVKKFQAFLNISKQVKIGNIEKKKHSQRKNLCSLYQIEKIQEKPVHCRKKVF